MTPRNPDAVTILADRDGGWKEAIAATVGPAAGEAILATSTYDARRLASVVVAMKAFESRTAWR